ncbi:MAG TPA: hypothetical protein VFA68_01500 [Terriglobales bacterium]|nr:hypothetical protein [Terriglobales bacterium]
MSVQPKDGRQAARAIVAQTLVILGISLFAQGENTPQPMPVLSAEAVVGKLIAANMRRARELRGYTAHRSYHVDYHGFPGSRDASMEVAASYTAPDKKEFKIISQSGSKFLITHIFQKLLESEQEYLKQSVEQSELSPRNYEFSLAGTDRNADGDFYVLEVTPKRKSQFLYRGKIWVEAHDFAVARIQGEPAKNPSFWISHTSIDHRYRKFGDFWLPVHNESVTQVRLGGKATLSIDYGAYQVSSSKVRVAHVAEPDAVLPPPGTITADPH